MKPIVKRILLISLFLILLGSLISGGVLLLNKSPLGVYRINGKWIYVGDEIEQISIHEDLEPFSELNISFISGEIELIPSDRFRLEYDGVKYSDDPIYTLSGNVLNVLNLAKRTGIQMQFGGFSLAALPRNTLKIYYPKETKFGSVRINGGASSLKISGMQAGEIDIMEDYGSVQLDTVRATNLSLKGSSGNLSLTNIVASELSLNSDFGDQVLKNIVVEHTVDLRVGSGNITLGDIMAEKVTVHTDFGEINGEAIDIKRLILSSNSGDVNLAGSIKNDIQIDVDFGEVSLELKEKQENYNLSLDIDFGTIILDNQEVKKNYSEKNQGNNSIKINSSSGSITIIFDK